MQTRTHLLVALAALLAISCNNEPAEMPKENQHELTVVAALPDLAPESRATAESVIRLKWQAGDAVSAINLTTGKALGNNLTTSTAGTVVTFSGTLSGSITAGDKIALLYPAQNYLEEQDFTPVPINQTVQTGAFDIPVCVYGVIDYDGSGTHEIAAQFNYLVAYIRLNLSGLEANTQLQEVVIRNVAPTMQLGITETQIVATPQNGDISICPSGTTNAAGAQTLLFTTAASTEQSTRTIYVRQNGAWSSAEWSTSDLNSGSLYNSIATTFAASEAPDAE